MLNDELEKAAALAAKGLAADYVILTNHSVTGASGLQIKAAFEGVGVGRCRTFGYDWIVRQIRSSPRLRMMAPRLYGLGDLSDLLDARAYAQVQLILSAIGDDLQRLVDTRRIVRACAPSAPTISFCCWARPPPGSLRFAQALRWRSGHLAIRNSRHITR